MKNKRQILSIDRSIAFYKNLMKLYKGLNYWKIVLKLEDKRVEIASKIGRKKVLKKN